MKSKFLLATLIIAMVGCNKSQSTQPVEKDADNEPEQTENTISLVGEWRLLDFAGETEMAVMDSTTNYVLTINPDDSTFGLTTDCNSMGGQYIIAGDSIKFDNIAFTLMACPDEKVEMGMKAILPVVDTYAITPDSVLLLRSDMRTMARFSFVK